MNECFEGRNLTFFSSEEKNELKKKMK